MKTLNVGIIGFGMAGEVFHAPIIGSVEGFKIHTIRTSNPKLQRRAKQMFPEVITTSKSEDIFENPDIDLVLVLSPNEFHVNHASTAIKNGKHVVVDKPFTIRSDEAKNLIDLAESHKRILSVYQNRRFDGDIQTAKQIIASGKLGDIVNCDLGYFRFRPSPKDNWREEKVPGSGILYDLGPHLMDQAYLLFGKPIKVFAEVKSQRKSAIVDDSFDIKLYYPDNLNVTLRANMLTKEMGPRIQIHGENGSFVKYGSDPQENLLKLGVFPRDVPTWGAEAEEYWGILNCLEEGNDHKEVIPTVPGNYCKFYENIRDVILKGDDLLIKPIEAHDHIRLIELCVKSHEEGRILECDF